ncbi:endonuclease III [soil metagenome]
MPQPTIDWSKAVKPLIKKYKNEKHPLGAGNLYEMLVMVVLSARSNDKLINTIAPELFKAYPNMQSLARAKPEDLQPLLAKVINWANKAKWLLEIASTIKTDKNIPLDIDKMVELPSIGRKSANVIKRFAGAPYEGVIVDLHVVRVSQRLGIATSDDPVKIEKQIMEVLPQKEWEAGMSMSFLGRDICRPKPECEICLMNKVCAFYNGWKTTGK